MTTPNNRDTLTASRSGAGRITVEVVEDSGVWADLADPVGTIREAVDAVGAGAKLVAGPVSICVALSSDRVIEGLNAQYRGKEKATNVLSFPAGPGAQSGFLGDIILAQETVQREAEEQATGFREHVQHLVVHGLLHLLGYDHEDFAEAERMESLEIAILARIGIANPYVGELDTAK